MKSNYSSTSQQTITLNEFKNFEYIKNKIDELCKTEPFTKSNRDEFTRKYTALWSDLRKEGFTETNWQDVVRSVKAKPHLLIQHL